VELEQVVADLVQQAQHRVYGKYRGIVKDNADPKHLGRLKLQVPGLFGSDVVTGWAMPCVPYGGDADQGFLFIPELGAGVWVEFEQGDIEFPIWVGTFWSAPDGNKSELPKPNEPDGTEQSDVQDPPTRKIIKTKKGHTLQFEDADGDECVILYEGKNKHVVTLDKDGVKIVDGKNSHEITLASGGITIKDKSGNEIATTSQGLTCTDANGNTIKMDNASGFPTGPGIDLNGGKRVCLDGLITWLLKHQHVGNMGAPTPLFPGDMPDLIQAMASPGSSILSDTVKAK